MSFRSTGWYCYPWNLHDVDRDMASMADGGMSHLTLAASYHAGKFIHPRDPQQRVYFPEDGTVYFAHDPSRYGRLHPLRASIMEQRDVLRAVSDNDSLSIRAWTVLNHNSRLGWLHPDLVARNAWGDPYYYSLCPANDDVQDYAVALCSDIAASYPIECLLLETPGWLTYDHGYHHEFAQVETSAEVARLLGLCFCNACEIRAATSGIDIGSLRLAVSTRCDVLLGGTAVPDKALDETLAAFDVWRATVVTGLCARIRQEARKAVGVRVISTCQRPHRSTYLEGGDLAALSAATDGLELPVYQPSADAAEEDLQYVMTQVLDVDRLSVILRPGFPDMQSEAQVLETVNRMSAAGIGDISFYNFGLLPNRSIGWTYQAVANARSKFA